MLSKTSVLRVQLLVLFLLFSTGVAADDHEGGESPQTDSDLSDSETSFNGAVMLVGNDDVTLQGLDAGELGAESDMRYAFFVGNTLYAGVADEFGNTSDLIGEFFWFESSIDRGSDFYVGVFKLRTSPQELEGWRLETGNSILYLDANADLSAQNGSFRWDWSVPFESYGWDSYGSVNLETEYGLGLNAEGSAMTATGSDEDGVSYSASVQSKGYLNSEFTVRTQYQITLWRWEVMVAGSAGHMSWDMVLNSFDREDQNAYHEFFLVMQTGLGEPFEIRDLEFGGQVKDPAFMWFDRHSDLSARIPSIILTRPDLPPPEETGPEETGDDDDDGPTPPDDNEGGAWPVDDEDEPAQPEDDDPSSLWSAAPGGGCSQVGTVSYQPSGNEGLLLGILFAGVATMRRRRRAG
jgi:hypothetical protein